jgi:hypothetical protein
MLVAAWYVGIYKVLWNKPNKIQSASIRLIANVALAIFAGGSLYFIFWLGEFIANH